MKANNLQSLRTFIIIWFSQLISRFAGVFVTGSGAGIVLLYVMCSVCMLLVGLIEFFIPLLRDVEKILPDHDIETLGQR